MFVVDQRSSLLCAMPRMAARSGRFVTTHQARKAEVADDGLT